MDDQPPPPRTTTPGWLTSLLVVAVVALVALSICAGLVSGWSAVGVLALAVVIVLGTAASDEVRDVAVRLIEVFRR